MGDGMKKTYKYMLGIVSAFLYSTYLEYIYLYGRGGWK